MRPTRASAIMGVSLYIAVSCQRSAISKSRASLTIDLNLQDGRRPPDIHAPKPRLSLLIAES
jgi:hypothetical protein